MLGGLIGWEDVGEAGAEIYYCAMRTRLWFQLLLFLIQFNSYVFGKISQVPMDQGGRAIVQRVVS